MEKKFHGNHLSQLQKNTYTRGCAEKLLLSFQQKGHISQFFLYWRKLIKVISYFSTTLHISFFVLFFVHFLQSYFHAALLNVLLVEEKKETNATLYNSVKEHRQDNFCTVENSSAFMLAKIGRIKNNQSLLLKNNPLDREAKAIQTSLPLDM